MLLPATALSLLSLGGAILSLVSAGPSPAADAGNRGSNGRIVFASNRDGDYDIYTMRADGSDVTQLTFNRAEDRQPSWSADGNRIVYVSDGDVWTMEADGTLKYKRTEGGGEVNHPSWAPDGDRIVFEYDASIDGELHPQLYVIDPRRSDFQHITPPERSDYYYHATLMRSPAWSPAGGTIAVVIYYSECPDFLNQSYGSCTAVVLLNEDGSNPRAVAVQDGGIGAIDWSPDATRFAVVLPSSETRRSDLAVLSLDGRLSRVTTNSPETADDSPAWSPDGSSILFSTSTPHSDYERDHGPPSELATIRADGSGRHIVGSAPSDDLEPSWQPVGPSTLPMPAAVMRLGRGIASWKIGKRRRIGRDYLRTERHRKNDRGGCIGGPEQASFVDYYAGFRVSSVKGRRGRFFVVDVATNRAGDRGPDGFVIGQARFRAVRSKHPRAYVSRRSSRYSLGLKSLSLYQSTGYESGKYLIYWFDGQGMLVALQTGVSGC